MGFFRSVERRCVMPASTLVEPLCSDCSHPLVTTIEGERLCPDCTTDVGVCHGCDEPTRTLHPTTAATLLCARCVSGWTLCADCADYTREIRTLLDGRHG